MKPTLILSCILAFALTLTSSFSFAFDVIFKNDTSHEAWVTILNDRCPNAEIRVAAGKEGKVSLGPACWIRTITVPGAVAFTTAGTSYRTFGLVMNPNTGKEQVGRYLNGKPVDLNSPSASDAALRLLAQAPAPAPAPVTSNATPTLANTTTTSHTQGNQNVVAPVGTSNQGTTTTASSEVKQQLMKCLGNKAIPEGKEGLYQCLSAAGWKQ
jgi:hypothetical protein